MGTTDDITSTEGEFIQITKESPYWRIITTELEKREWIYGDQKPWIRKIARGRDLICESLIVKSKPACLLIYSSELVLSTRFPQIKNSLRVKTFLPIDKNVIALKNMKKTLDRAMEIAVEKKATGIYLICSEKEFLTYRFLVNNNFETFYTMTGKTCNGFKEYLMCKKLTDAKEETVASGNVDDSCVDCNDEGIEIIEEKSGKQVEVVDIMDCDNDNDTSDDNRADSVQNNENNSGRSTSEILNCKLTKKDILYIKTGEITVVAKLRTSIFRHVQEGMIVKFKNYNKPDEVYVRIKKINRYKDFRTMLEAEGFRNCKPYVSNISEAVLDYYKHKSMKEREYVGVLACKIEKVEQDHERKI